MQFYREEVNELDAKWKLQLLKSDLKMTKDEKEWLKMSYIKLQLWVNTNQIVGAVESTRHIMQRGSIMTDDFWYFDKIEQ